MENEARTWRSYNPIPEENVDRSNEKEGQTKDRLVLLNIAVIIVLFAVCHLALNH